MLLARSLVESTNGRRRTARANGKGAGEGWTRWFGRSSDILLARHLEEQIAGLDLEANHGNYLGNAAGPLGVEGCLHLHAQGRILEPAGVGRDLHKQGIIKRRSGCLAHGPSERREWRFPRDWRPSACETQSSNRPATSECGMRNRKAQFRILPMISPFRIPNSAFLQVSASPGFSSIPIGAIVARIRSPGLRNVPVAEPTPDGVPVAMMSPGSSVTN